MNAQARVSLVLTLAILCGSLLSGCSLTPGGAGSCMPPKFTLSSATAKANTEITVSAKGARCDPAYGDNAKVAVSLTDSTGKKIVDVIAPMADDGAFSYRLLVPANAVAGQAAVEAYPHDVDWCDDTGRNNRKANPKQNGNVQGAAVSTAQDVDFELASCAERMVPLQIIK